MYFEFVLESESSVINCEEAQRSFIGVCTVVASQQNTKDLSRLPL